MYFYLPNHRYGNDKVALIQGEDFQLGAIYEIDGEWAVCLGNTVAFSELIKPYRRDGSLPDSINCVFEGVLSAVTLQVIHRFVNHRFTSYHKTMPLWLGDIDQLIKRKKTGRKKKGGTWSVVTEKRMKNGERRESLSDTILNHNSSHEYEVNHAEIGLEKLNYTLDRSFSGQTLLVFPTMRSLHQHLQGGLLDLPGSLVLHGQLQAAARAKAFWEIKSGSVHTIYATYSQVFRDWNALKKVILIDQHAWRYKNYQEPRYFAPTVIAKMSEILDCEYLKTGEVIGGGV